MFCAASVAAMMTASQVMAADAAADDARPVSEIIVLGKTYDLPVGKTVTPLKDVPNTVSVVDREQMKAQNLFTLEDALTAVPGVTVTGVGSEDPSFLSRGFTINNYLVDGTPTLAFAFPSVVPDLFFYERMEVLRGPAGLFSGSGNPAGSINMVRKRPLKEQRIEAALGYGSWNNKRAEVDISAPLADYARLRTGVMVQDQDQFFDVGHRNRKAAFLTGSVDMGEKTTLTAGVTYDRFQPAIQSGLPGIIGGADGSDGQLLNISRKTYLGADWNRFDAKTWTGFGEISHKLSDQWQLRVSGLYSDVDRRDIYSYIGSQPVTPTNGLTNHIAYAGDSFAKTGALDVNLIGSFSLFGRDQTLIIGADYQESTYYSYYTRLSNYARIDIYNPVSPIEPPLNPYGPLPAYPGPNGPVTQVYGGTVTEVEQKGTYGQLRLSPIEGVTLIGGGRLTWWETKGRTLLPTLGAQTGYSIKKRFTPYAGLVWDVTRQLNVYGSYADSFTPQTNALPRADGEQIKPLIGEQFEGGAKLSLFGDTLLLSAAAYQITQTNRIYTDADFPGVIFQTGKVRSRGVELEANGEILPGWRVNGGYAYTKTEYLKDTNPGLIGAPLLPVVPKHSVKLFTNYTVADGPLAGASVGGGLTWFTKTFGGNAAVFNADGTLRTRSTIVRQGSFAVFDLRAGYKFSERVEASLNVTNLFDKKYYSRISATGRGNYYGQPRAAFVTLRYTQ